MRVHVLPGDSLTEEFRKTGINGDIIVCRECLVVGPVDADNPDEFWDQRAHFILAEYAEDEIAFHERVADELEQLRDIEAGTEVHLWFEYELFCSVNMWFCISLLQDTGADIYRVEPVELSTEDRWKGFGQLDASELQKCFDARKLLTKDDIDLGSSLWAAFREGDNEKLSELAARASDRFPYLQEVVDAATQKDTLPVKLLREIKRDGIKEFDDIFAEFTQRAGVYGFGDLQVQRLLDHLP
jgi:hypothetical protein